MTDRTELRRLLEKATPRPWHAWNRGIGFEVHTEAEHNPIRCDPLNSGFRETFGGPDAHLIAAAINALPDLLDEAELLATVRDQVTHGALCPMCSTGVARWTVGLVCQLCGTDYSRPEYETLQRDSADTGKAVLAARGGEQS